MKFFGIEWGDNSDALIDYTLERLGIKQRNQEEIEKAVDKAMELHPKIVETYRQGKFSAIHFLIGKTMLEIQGADPKKVRQILETRLNESLVTQ